MLVKYTTPALVVLLATVLLAGGAKPGGWHRATLKADQARVATPIAFKPSAGLEIMNVFVRELKEK